MTPLPNAESVARVPEPNMDDEQPTFSSSSVADVPTDASSKNGMANGLFGINVYSESDRLRTFENWTVPFIDKRDLAAAGFYYTGNSDLVKCPYCEIEVGRWVPGDEPFSEHRKHSSRCRFIVQKMASSDVAPDESPSIGEDTCGPYGIERTRTPALEIERLARDEMLEKLKINPSDIAQFPQYCTYEERLKSFENWPIPYKIAPDALSMAGFVYSKSEDRTYCFHCGGSLHNWDEYDEPWVEHAHWFPKCKFVLKTRGQKFIDDARVKKHEDLARTQEEMKNAIETIKEIVSTADVNKVSTKNCKESSSEGNNSSDESSISQDAAESLSFRDRATRMCLICLVEERNTVLLPCYHVVACTKCVNKLKNCCVCREPVIYRRRIYIP